MTPTVFLHTIFALVCIPVGAYLLFSKKGTPIHKRAGQVYIAGMLVVAFSGVFIQEIRDGQFSFIHLLIPFTIFSLAYAIWAIRKFKVTRNIKWRNAHRNAMVGLYIGGLVIAGVLTLLPGRVIYNLLFT